MELFKRFPAVVLLLPAIGLAKGNSPDRDKDAFPDYNHLDIHHRSSTEDTPHPSNRSDSDASIAPQMNRASEDLDHPKPPPPAQPSRDDSEPDLPQDGTKTGEASRRP